jgi:hypothetical protein
MKYLAALLLLVGSFVAAAILYTYVEFAYFSPLGFDEVGSAVPTKPLLLSGCSLLGIISKRLFDAAGKSRTTLAAVLESVLAPVTLIRAIVVCPIVIISLYSRLQEINDIFLVSLIAYQNGFFFEAILQTRGKVVGQEVVG